MKLKSFGKFRDKMLKDPEIRKAYDALELDFSVIEQVLKKRLQKKMTQADLAKKMGTKQSAIARLESGSYNPSVAFLYHFVSILTICSRRRISARSFGRLGLLRMILKTLAPPFFA